MKEKLLQLKNDVENVEIIYDYDSVYTELINLTIDYQNDTQDWCFECVFEEYIDDELLKYQVEYNLKEFGVWAVKNLLDDIQRDSEIYRIDAYGYGHDITISDLESIKEQILEIISDKLEELD